MGRMARQCSCMMDKQSTKNMTSKDYDSHTAQFITNTYCETAMPDDTKINFVDQGCVVGHIEITDDLLSCTPQGATRRRALKRLPANESWEKGFLCIGAGDPWNPNCYQLGSVGEKTTTLRPDGCIANSTTTTNVLEKYGGAVNCRGCEIRGAHSALCRKRIEKEMVDAGEAFDTDETRNERGEG